MIVGVRLLHVKVCHMGVHTPAELRGRDFYLRFSHPLRSGTP